MNEYYAKIRIDDEDCPAFCTNSYRVIRARNGEDALRKIMNEFHKGDIVEFKKL